MSVAAAFLLQTQPSNSLTPQTILEQYTQDWPDTDIPTWDADDQEDEAVYTFDVEDFVVGVTFVSAPVGDIEWMTAPSRLWRDETPFHNDHTHILVSVMGLKENSELDAHVVLSRVVASLIAVSPEVFAVFLPEPLHLVEPPAFRDLALAILPDPLVYAWVAFNMARRPEDGVLTAHSRGLNALGLMDIEIPDSKKTEEETFNFLENLVLYLLEHGLIIKDGETVGESAEEKILVTYAPSLVQEDTMVIRLDFQQEKPRKRGFFKRK